MPIVKKTYHAEIIVTVSELAPDSILSEQEVAEAMIEMEQALNAIPGVKLSKTKSVYSRVHMKGEVKNGNDQD